MISVLMPSRNRFDMAKESIESLGLGDFEVLMWVDNDDDQLNLYKNLKSESIKIYFKDRVGYKNFHEMINFLSEQTNSEWLMLWNDDARIKSDNWINLINENNHEHPLVLNLCENPSSTNNLFPIISRKMYELINHFSLSTHCDSWVVDIANEIAIHKLIHGGSIIHKRDEMSDNTKLETSSAYLETSPKYFSEEMINLRKKDIDKIKFFIEQIKE
jgi:hypothetical protein